MTSTPERRPANPPALHGTWPRSPCWMRRRSASDAHHRVRRSWGTRARRAVGRDRRSARSSSTAPTQNTGRRIEIRRGSRSAPVISGWRPRRRGTAGRAGGVRTAQLRDRRLILTTRNQPLSCRSCCWPATTTVSASARSITDDLPSARALSAARRTSRRRRHRACASAGTTGRVGAFGSSTAGPAPRDELAASSSNDRPFGRHQRRVVLDRRTPR